MAQGARLSREERRAQLVELGVQLVASSSFDELSVDEVADEAGISRTLLYHYFPTKRRFMVAVAEAALDELLAATEPDPSLPVDERLRASLAAHIDFVAPRRAAFLSLVRGASGRESLQAVVERAYEVFAGRVLAGLEMEGGASPPLLDIAVRGWIAFMEEAVVRWLTEQRPSREELIGLLEHVLLESVAAAGVEVRP